LVGKIEKSEAEVKQRNTVIGEKQKENFNEEINNVKQLKEDYWDKVSTIKKNIEIKYLYKPRY